MHIVHVVITLLRVLAMLVYSSTAMHCSADHARVHARGQLYATLATQSSMVLACPRVMHLGMHASTSRSRYYVLLTSAQRAILDLGTNAFLCQHVHLCCDTLTVVHHVELVLSL